MLLDNTKGVFIVFSLKADIGEPYRRYLHTVVLVRSYVKQVLLPICRFMEACYTLVMRRAKTAKLKKPSPQPNRSPTRFGILLEETHDFNIN